jgi:2-methylcitrate dehydratase PrpD
MTTLSLSLGEHVATCRFDDLPAAAVEAAKASLLDALGVSFAASGLGEGVQPFIDLALESGGRGEATVLGVGEKAPMLMAALANGALAHALDFEDAHDEALLHPNAQIIPALLGIAEAKGASGRDFLTALAVGCDLVCRLKLAARTDPADLGWYPPALLGGIGSAAAAAKLLGASAEQVVDALSLALGPAASSAEVKFSPRSHVRAVRDAFAAHAGLLAARLAVGGVKGFDRPIEGQAGLYALYAGGEFDEGALTADLGRRFEGANVSFKPWPACRGTHAFIEMALALKQAHGFAAADIAELTLTGGPIQQMLIEPRAQRLTPKTAIDAKFSTPFTTALTLARGEPGLASYDPEQLVDPEVLDLAARTGCQTQPDAGRPASWGRLEITLKDGAALSAEVDYALGHPTKPLGWPRLAAKFEACARYAQRPPSRAEAARMVEAVASLDQAPDVAAALFGR